MANILVIHPHIPLRASLLDYVRLNGHTGFEAADVHQARLRRGAGAYALVVVGVGESDRTEPPLKEIRNEWPMAEVAVVRGTTDLVDVFEAIKHCEYGSHTEARAEAGGEPWSDGSTSSWLSDRSRRPYGHEAQEEAVAVDPVTRALFEKADRVAAVNSTVLITGPSGTGKEVLARRIHRHSARRSGKFVPVNCGCLPETLIETELFGYKKGAFTGAVTNHRGLIEEAERGVLFLDEIGDMPLLMQVRLLRFLDSGEVRAVGDTYLKHADVRVIAATNTNLPEAIRQRRFREDLFFRLSVVQLDLPPLRERRSDISALVEHYVRRASAKLGLAGAKVSPEALALLVRYEWPGNIRELQNTIEQALVQKTGETITPDDLPAAIRHGIDTSIRPREKDGPLADERVLLALRRHNGNHTDAAAELGISRTTLWRRLRQLERVLAKPVQVLAADCAPQKVS